jgi:acyl phosphate:glycerol-3-phosphate acyltransferase
MLENILLVLIRIAFCFLLGSVPFAVLSMMGTGIDIRKVGSGNPGFNNVLRVNKARAVLTLAGDMGKGLVAVWVALHVGPGAPSPFNPVTMGWIFGFAAILGHCYSPFLGFNGGKGIATSGGVMLVLYPMWAALALVYFAVTRIALGKLKWHEAGATASLSTWVLFTILVFIFSGRLDGLFAALMTIFLGWRHKNNLRKLLSPAQP